MRIQFTKKINKKIINNSKVKIFKIYNNKNRKNNLRKLIKSF